MKAKSLLQIIAALMISAAMATTTIAAGKINPAAVSKGMLTALNNQAGLSADQQDKAKPIIDTLTSMLPTSRPFKTIPRGLACSASLSVSIFYDKWFPPVLPGELSKKTPVA
jgi:hypothetical protein